MPHLKVCSCRKLLATVPCQDCKRRRDQHHNADPVRQAHHTPQHQRIKQIVYQRDPNHCIDCGTTIDLTIDYVIPLALGGPMHQDNAVIRCRSDNSRRGAKVRRTA